MMLFYLVFILALLLIIGLGIFNLWHFKRRATEAKKLIREAETFKFQASTAKSNIFHFRTK